MCLSPDCNILWYFFGLYSGMLLYDRGFLLGDSLNLMKLSVTGS